MLSPPSNPFAHPANFETICAWFVKAAHDPDETFIIHTQHQSTPQVPFLFFECLSTSIRDFIKRLQQTSPSNPILSFSPARLTHQYLALAYTHAAGVDSNFSVADKIRICADDESGLVPPDLPWPLPNVHFAYTATTADDLSHSHFSLFCLTPSSVRILYLGGNLSADDVTPKCKACIHKIVCLQLVDLPSVQS